MLIAAPNPSRKVTVNKIDGVTIPANASVAIITDTVSMKYCATKSKRLLSNTSANAPPGRASKTSDKLVAVCISATVNGEGVSDVINQAAPTFCMDVPMLDATVVIHNILNSF